MKNEAEYDFENDWKLYTILIGGNDLCATCIDEVIPSCQITSIVLIITEDMLNEHTLLSKRNVHQVTVLGTKRVICIYLDSTVVGTQSSPPGEIAVVKSC